MKEDDDDEQAKANIPRVECRTIRQIEDIARQELQTIKGYVRGKPVPIQDYIEFGTLKARYNVDYAVSNMNRGYIGRFDIDKDTSRKTLTIDQQQWILGLEAKGKSRAHARFTVAHEIGHAILHGQELVEMAKCEDPHVLYIRGEIEPENECPEWQADRFAEAILMSAESVSFLLDTYKARLSGGFGKLLMRNLDVPRTMILTRIRTLVDLNMIDERVFKSFMDSGKFWWGEDTENK